VGAEEARAFEAHVSRLHGGNATLSSPVFDLTISLGAMGAMIPFLCL
jgi:hypothetical protein